jgi:hypothetical protein
MTLLRKSASDESSMSNIALFMECTEVESTGLDSTALPFESYENSQVLKLTYILTLYNFITY